jgi:hypothetical protein
MSPALATFAWVAGTWLAVALGAAWAWHRATRHQPKVASPADADHDLRTCQTLWNLTHTPRKEQQ